MTRRAALAVDVQIADENPDVPPVSDIEHWVTRAFDAASTSFPSGAEVSVRVVDTEEMQALNRDYRSKDTATNVLSFPAGELAGLPDDAPRTLGDIVVCAAIVAEEAEAQGKTCTDHWAHMLVHGLLHLLGYDHGSDAEAIEMEGLEIQVLASGGVGDPYAK